MTMCIYRNILLRDNFGLGGGHIRSRRFMRVSPHALTCLGAPLSGCIALSVRWRRGRVVRRHVCSFSDTKCNVSYWLVLTFDWQVIMAPQTCTSTPTRRVPCQTPVSSPSRRIVSLAPSTCPRLSAERVSPSLSAGPRYHDITQHVRPVGFIIVTFL